MCVCVAGSCQYPGLQHPLDGSAPETQPPEGHAAVSESQPFPQASEQRCC